MYYYVGILLLYSLTQIIYADGIRSDTACEHEKVVPKCPRGYTIDIKTAIYGKLNPHICHVSADKIVNDCSAGNALDLAKFKCNLKETCTLYASNYLFGDPCPGTFKYLEVTYNCTKGHIQSKVACEYEELDLKCDEGTYLWIANALYGRTNQDTCAGPNWSVRSNSCRSENAMSVVELKCDNLQECKINASNEVFGDPCFGTHKYLKVDYQCLSRNPDPITRITFPTDGNNEVLDPLVQSENDTSTISVDGNEITFKSITWIILGPNLKNSSSEVVTNAQP